MMNLGGTVHLNRKGFFILLTLTCIILLYLIKSDSFKQNIDTNINLHQLLNIAIKSAENGGLEVVSTKDKLKIKSKGLTKEGLQDDVTTADYLSHCSMVSTIKHFFPTIKLISEENVECDNNQVIDFNGNINPQVGQLPDEFVNENDVTVWIDPLDATHEYTEKLYKYVTTMVCVAVKGEPIIGVIHKPFARETSWSWLGKGKSENLNTQKTIQDKKRIIISRSHHGNIKEVLQQNFKNKFELIIAAGAGYKALEVATGNADAYLHITAIKKWDICAGNAILKAVNGVMTTKHNKKIDYTDETNVVNEDGLIATLDDHSSYLGIM